MKPVSITTAGLLLLALSHCAPPMNTADAGRDAAVSAPGTAVCARIRMLNCMGAEMCMAFFNDPSTTLGPNAARCATQFNAWVACLDSNAATFTCETSLNASTGVCASPSAALGACTMGSADGGVSEDATAPTDSGVRPLPAPADWPMGTDIQIELSGWSTGASTGPGGSALLGIGPIGTPSNARIFQFSGVVHGGTATDCRVGLLYDASAGAYTFSNDMNLTQTCALTGSDRATSLTFTGARVLFDSIGRLAVEITARATGGTLNGESGQVTVAYNN